MAGRFGREKLFRLAETRRVLDGDTLLIKLNDGRLQGIQGDLVRNPDDLQGDTSQWVDGVRITNVGRALAFGVHRRTGNTSTQFVRRVNATNVIHYGFFERYAGDQVRGVSPLVSSVEPAS